MSTQDSRHTASHQSPAGQSNVKMTLLMVSATVMILTIVAALFFRFTGISDFYRALFMGILSAASVVVFLILLIYGLAQVVQKKEGLQDNLLLIVISLVIIFMSGRYLLVEAIPFFLSGSAG